MGLWGGLTVVGASPTLDRKISGSSSGVERKLPKLDVAGSIPVSRSIIRLANLVGRIFLFLFEVLPSVQYPYTFTDRTSCPTL